MSSTAPTSSQPGKWVVTAFGSPSVLQWTEFPDNEPPTLGENEVLIRILTTGISGVDNMMRAGAFPGPKTTTPGFTPGQECVGEIIRLGANTQSSNFSVGDLILSYCFLGAYATHLAISTTELIKLKKDDDVVKMVTLPLNYMTAYGMLTRSAGVLSKGSSVLVGGASGGIGTAIAQIAKTFDLGLNLLGTCSPSNFDYVRNLGFTPIDRHDSQLATTVKNLTGGKGVDVAFDATGTKESVLTSAAATKEDVGQVVVYGLLDATASASKTEGRLGDAFDDVQEVLSFIEAMPKAKFWAVSWDYYMTSKEDYLKDLNKVIGVVRQKKLEPLVGNIYRLDQAVEANEALVSGSGRGKMVFLVDAELAAKRGL
jgi:NADPH2:quinone reductase